MKLYAAACNCDNCRESGWRAPQWILDGSPWKKADIVLYGEAPQPAEGGA